MVQTVPIATVAEITIFPVKVKCLSYLEFESN